MNAEYLKKRSEFTSKLIVDLVTYCYILLFVYAAVSKFIDYENFKVQIGQSPLLSDFSTIITWLVPCTEIIIACMLIIPRLQALGLYAAMILMTLFTAYITAILNFSESIPCSCGGILSKMGWKEHLVFNLAFMVMAVTAIVLQTKLKKQSEY